MYFHHKETTFNEKMYEYAVNDIHVNRALYFLDRLKQNTR